MPSNPDTQKITVIGAGLVGSLISIMLARRGYDVELYERRPDMRVEKISAGRSINLAISTRGLYALKQVELEQKILDIAVPMKGRMIHTQKRLSPNSSACETMFQAYGKDESQYINSIPRGELNKILMTEAEKTGRVKIHFNHTLAAQDLKGWLEMHPNRLIIGTDGSTSVVREHLSTLNPQFKETQDTLSHGYKELTIPAKSGGGFLLEKNALHIWPRGSFMLIALPNQDGSFTCTLFLPWVGPVSFDTLKTPTDVERFFNEYFPDSVPLIENLSETFFTNPTGKMVTIKCSPWFSTHRLLLLGDAAHAIVPFFGQGMNCGFEDCTVLSEWMDRSPQDWVSQLEPYFHSRKPNSDAIADLAVDNFIEMRDRVGDPKFLLKKEVEKILQNRFPEKYISRYGLVTFSRHPYSVALEAGKIQEKILEQLCSGLSNPNDVDLRLAEKLIDKEFTPFFKKSTHS